MVSSLPPLPNTLNPEMASQVAAKHYPSDHQRVFHSYTEYMGFQPPQPQVASWLDGQYIAAENKAAVVYTDSWALVIGVTVVLRTAGEAETWARRALRARIERTMRGSLRRMESLELPLKYFRCYTSFWSNESFWLATSGWPPRGMIRHSEILEPGTRSWLTIIKAKTTIKNEIVKHLLMYH